MFFKKTKRRKDFEKLFKLAKKKFDCDEEIDSVWSRYEFTIYNADRKEVENFFKNTKVQIINFENALVIREWRQL